MYSGYDIKKIADAGEEKVRFKHIKKNETGDGFKRTAICSGFAE